MKPSWLISREAFRRSVTANLLVTAIAFLAGFAALQAQTLTTGDVTGSVMDQSGAVVPGATVTITNLEAGTKQTATTNDGGVYRVSFLAPGNYVVTAAAAVSGRVLVLSGRFQF